MPDRLFARSARHLGSEVNRVFVAGVEADMIFAGGHQIMPSEGLDTAGRLGTRIVLDAGEKWFEVGFRMDALLSGNPAAGWTDAGNYLRIDYEWSEDLVTWSAGKFLPAPVPIVDNGDGTWSYWARAINPVDAASKTGLLRFSQGIPGLGDAGNADSRHATITGVEINSVLLPLTGAPYVMPTDAARLQTDLRAHYPAAIVTAVSALQYAVEIPGVSQTLFDAVHLLHIPPYDTIDPVFGVLITISALPFAGSYVDAAGTPVVPRAFARLKYSSGTRFQP